MPRFEQEDEELLSLSGPHVWPRLSADLVYDRYIFQRPEIRYLRAKEKMRAWLEDIREEDLACPTDSMLITVIRTELRGNKNRRRRATTNIGTFAHGFHHDPMVDVQQFLVELRSFLSRHMPDAPSFGTSVRLRFQEDVFRANRRVFGTHTGDWT